MGRSVWKGPFLGQLAIQLMRQNENKSGDYYRIDRNSVIIPAFIEKTVTVHNGKSLNTIKVKKEMLGLKFGEFVITRKRHVFKKKKKKKK